MAVRPEAMANRIADGIVEQIRNHANTSPHLWKKVPETLKRGLNAKDEDGPMPLVVVSSNGTTVEQATRDNEYNRSHKSLTVLMMTRDTSDAEGAIEDLLADVWRAIAANRQLTDIDDPTTPVLVSGRIILGNSESWALGDGAGTGMATLDLTVEFSRNYLAP